MDEPSNDEAEASVIPTSSLPLTLSLPPSSSSSALSPSPESDLAVAQQATRKRARRPPLPGSQSLPASILVTGVWANLSRKRFERLVAQRDSNLVDKEVKLGLPRTWTGPPPTKGERIIACNSCTTFVSPGPGVNRPRQPTRTREACGFPRQATNERLWNTSVLSEALPPPDQFTFVPLRNPNSGPEVAQGAETSESEDSPPRKRSAREDEDSPLPKGVSTAGGKDAMVGKKSGRALQLEEGLERTDNGMKFSSWPEVGMINQKNYYTEYMKRDDQVLPLRLQAEANRDKMIRTAKDRDRALARTGNSDVPGAVMDDGEFGIDEAGTGPGDDFDASKIIVIHPGSQNMRIGFASDALPKTIPLAQSLKWRISESDQWEARPRRHDDEATPEHQFGDEFAKKFARQCHELKIDMRANKRKVLPNSKELVINYNRRTPPDTIPEHNDPVRIEWTDVKVSNFFTGHAALRVPDDSKHPFHLFRPIENGTINERDYPTKTLWQISMGNVVEQAIREELGVDNSTLWKQYSCVFVIPDLYDKAYVEELLEIAMTELEFSRVCFIQESLSASFGAGYTTACIVDVGAQKTSVCCIEDGMCVEDSRINLKYGGYDVTETFIKMMLHDHFPYQEINLRRRYDFLLAEELKIKFCTMNQADISVQLFDFHLRAPSEPTRKYYFKTYDEVILAPMGFYDPSIFDNAQKRHGHRKLFDRSYNVYDPDVPDDPVSAAQVAILTTIKPSLGISSAATATSADVSTPAKEKPQPFNLLSRLDSDFLGHNATPGTSTAGSPGPEGTNTPNANGTNGHGNGGSPGPSNMFLFGNSPAPQSKIFAKSLKDVAAERDSVLPIAPLDVAILTSIQHAAKDDEKKLRDLIGGIMVIGGGAKTPGFGPVLEGKLKQKRPDLADKILVGTSPREMDGQVVAWKGASVFAKLNSTNDSWISPGEYERLGSRVLYFKLMFNY